MHYDLLELSQIASELRLTLARVDAVGLMAVGAMIDQAIAILDGAIVEQSPPLVRRAIDPAAFAFLDQAAEKHFAHHAELSRRAGQ